MVDDSALRRRQMREKVAELKNAAITKLEGLGYNVRGENASPDKAGNQAAARENKIESRTCDFKLVARICAQMSRTLAGQGYNPFGRVSLPVGNPAEMLAFCSRTARRSAE